MCTVDFVEEFKPSIFLMENVGELLKGKFAYHFDTLRNRLHALGYEVTGSVHNLSDFGVPQSRNRALIVAVKRPRVARELEDLWSGYAVADEAKTVRRAIGHLPEVEAGTRHLRSASTVSRDCAVCPTMVAIGPLSSRRKAAGTT